MGRAPVVRAENVDFSWNATEVFRSFTARFTGVTAVIGPSGCGKTTLIKLLAGTCRPQAGSIVIDGIESAAPAPRIGIVFQEPQLLPWRTVRENIELVAPGLGERRETWLRRLELDGAGDVVPGRLSGGMKQRAALARALTIDPEILLVDEPLTGLDHVQSLELSEVLRGTIRELGSTVVMNTHDVDLALSIGERIVLLGRPPTGVAHTWETSSHDRDALKAEVVEALSSIRAR